MLHINRTIRVKDSLLIERPVFGGILGNVYCMEKADFGAGF